MICDGCGANLEPENLQLIHGVVLWKCEYCGSFKDVGKSLEEDNDDGEYGVEYPCTISAYGRTFPDNMYLNSSSSFMPVITPDSDRAFKRKRKFMGLF